MSSQIKSLIFAAALCIACSVLLTGANTGLKPLQQRNMAVDRHRNILLALGLVREGEAVPNAKIESLYDTYVKSIQVDRDGKILTLEKPAKTDCRCMCMSSKSRSKLMSSPSTRAACGVKFNGYLAIENDGATIRGFTVYKHTETPGLGGEIESRWFRKNFENKKIVNAQGSFASIGIAKGAVSDVIPEPKRDNYVDGISGATLTGKYLSAGLEDILQDYEPVAIEFRQKNLRYLRVQ
jgi:Na+-transporting NADH:ubiquinone oxidoreductase subunit C